jgi:hypothetical protein
MTAVRTYDWLHPDMPISCPDKSDEEVAGMVRMLMRTDLNHEAVCVAARDRIMCLHKELKAARDELEAVREQNAHLSAAIFNNPRRNDRQQETDT